MLRILFFGSIREQLQTSSIDVEYAGEETVSDLMAKLIEKGERWLILEEQDVLVAVNMTLCGKDAVINSGDELAFFPPVTGG